MCVSSRCALARVNKAGHTIHIIAGPTASGKTARALDLAREKDGVIINCDSLQVYDGLHILTAHPSKDEQEEIPHRLYSELHPNDPCSAGNWREMVKPVIEEVLAQGCTPIICGGTGLYIKSLTEGLSPIPDIPKEVRARVVEKYETIGAEAFYKELEKRDPVMAERFHANHKARIIRAMEVLEATGKSLAKWQELAPLSPPENWNFEIEIIMPERDELYRRCNDRFLWMLENGALKEAKDFGQKIKSGEVRAGVPLNKALGFKKLLAYIKGEMKKEEAIEQSQAETRRYAKRQVTWFRNQL